MDSIVLSIFTSLDGVVETPETWQGPFWNDELERYAHDLLHAADALLLGRVTYQMFAEAWPSSTDDTGFSERMNGLPKLVASRTLTSVGWNARLLAGPVLDEVAALKRGTDQRLLIYGSAGLSRGLMRAGLIDDYRIWLHPVVVGRGKRLFDDATFPATLRLCGTRSFGDVVVLSYRPSAAHAPGDALPEC